MTLERAILNVLAASPGPLPVTVIVGYVPGFTGEPVSQADATRTLFQLERKGHARWTKNDDGEAVWKETETGRLRIS